MVQLQQYLRGLYADGAPGAAAWVLDRGTPYVGVAEMADVDGEVPIGADTQFDIASLAKQFTGYCAFELIRTNRLSLRDAVAEYVPQFSTQAAVGASKSRRVTVGDLLFHTSGLPNYIPDASAQGKPGRARFDNASVIHRLANQSIVVGPGQRGVPRGDFEPELSYRCHPSSRYPARRGHPCPALRLLRARACQPRGGWSASPLPMLVLRSHGRRSRHTEPQVVTAQAAVR